VRDILLWIFSTYQAVWLKWRVLYAEVGTRLLKVARVHGAIVCTRVHAVMILARNAICTTKANVVAEGAIGVQFVANLISRGVVVRVRGVIFVMVAVKIVQMSNNGSFTHATVLTKVSLVVVV
jgi:hypothetical protein